MKFIINKDQIVSIDNKFNPNSGSINYYEAEVEFDESWSNLTISAIIVGKERNNEAISVAVIDNKIFIDKKMSGLYGIGFVGYKIENEIKTYQISTNLAMLSFGDGAGEIEVSNSEDVPTPTEWEIYIAQIQNMLDEFSPLPTGGTTGQVLSKKSNADGDVEWTQDIHLINAYLDDTLGEAILVLEMNNGTIFRIDLGNISTSDIQLVTKNNEVFLTRDDKKFILKEEE